VHIGPTPSPSSARDGVRVTHPRKRFGERAIDYRHYLPELARNRKRCGRLSPIYCAISARRFPLCGPRLLEAHDERETGRLLAKSSASWTDAKVRS
jgi:hypothetical protein